MAWSLICIYFSLGSLSQTWVVYMDRKEVEFNLIYQLLVSNGYTAIHNINFMAFDTWNLGVSMNLFTDKNIHSSLCSHVIGAS